jgi:hypothetical protein
MLKHNLRTDNRGYPSYRMIPAPEELNPVEVTPGSSPGSPPDVEDLGEPALPSPLAYGRLLVPPGR